MISYKDAGVDVQRGYDAVSLMKKHVQKTMNKNVLGDLGSFGGFFALDKEDCDEPVLVAGTDRSGHEAQIRHAYGPARHGRVDAVAMCVTI